MSSKDREERLKLGKERLHNETKFKIENKRKQQETNLTGELCRLKRKHLLMFHKLEYELLLNVKIFLYLLFGSQIISFCL